MDTATSKTKTCRWCGGAMLPDGDQDRCVECCREEYPARITLNGRIAERRLAKHKSFTCQHCKGEIFLWTYYYSVIYAGSGLGSIKFPDRTHQECILAFLGAEQ